MKKRLLSIVCATAILLSMFMPIASILANADTLAAGVYPYEEIGIKYEPIIRTESENAVAYQDFIVKSDIDGLEDANFSSKWRPYNSTTTSFISGGGSEYLKVSLETQADNVYGDSGKSFKATYTQTTNATVKPADLDDEKAFHYVRASIGAYTIANASKASVGFWVKTAEPVYMCVRLTANSTTTAGFIVSNLLSVPAGESFVEIPLACFKTLNAGFTLKTDGGATINNTDIYFMSTGSFTGKRDIYIDHLGYYTYASNPSGALHSTGAIVKNDIEGFALSGANVTNGTERWSADSKGTVNVSNPEISQNSNKNAYNGEGQSVYYTSANVTTSANNRFRTNGKIDTKDSSGNPLGVNAYLEVWIKTDRAIKLFLTADDSTMSNSGKNRYQCEVKTVPAGETMLNIPLSEFNTQYIIGDQTCDNLFKWDYLGSVNVYFCAAVDNGNSNATVYIDSIAVAAPPAPPAKHGEGFTEKVLSDNYWQVKTAAAGTYTLETNATDKYCTETSDTKSVKLSYTTAAANSTEFIRLVQNVDFQNPYGKESEIAFWVYTTQEVELGLLYVDRTGNKVSEGQITTTVYKTVVPAGERIIKVDITAFDKKGETMAYNWLNQWQWRVYGTSNTTSATGDIYFDAVGFYDTSGPEIPDTKVTHKDGFTEVALDSSKWKNKKAETATIATVSNAEFYHSGTTNVGANNSAVRVEYSNLSSTEELVNFYYNDLMRLSTEAPYIYESDSGIAFWVRADQPVDLVLTYADYNTGTAKGEQVKSVRRSVPAGESVVEIPMSEFAREGYTFEYRYANQFQIYVYSNADSYATSGTLYFDAFGFYDIDPTNEIPAPPAPPAPPEIPDTKVTHKDGFTEVALKGEKWSNKKKETSVLTVGENAEFYHSGTTNVGANNSAVRVEYSNLSSTESLVNFYYNEYMKLNDIAPFLYETDSGIAFWVRADQSVDLVINYMDYNLGTEKSEQVKSVRRSVPAGESIVEIAMSEFAREGYTFDYRYTYQFQIYVYSNADSYATSGTLYFDAFGFYDIDPTNEIPAPTKAPEIPDTKAEHKKGIYEVSLNNKYWTNKKPDTSTVEYSKNSEYYHSGKTNISENTGALRVSYTDIAAGQNLISFYYNNYMRMNEIAPYIYETDSGIAFWVRADQSVDLQITYMDYETAAGKGVQTATIVKTVPAGESIVEIPMSEFGKTGLSFENRYAYQLQISIRGNKDTVLKSGEIYFDAFGFYDIDPTNEIPAPPKAPEIPDTKAEHKAGFNEVSLNEKYWVNKKQDTSTVEYLENSEYYHSGKTNLGINKSALKVTYTDIAASQSLVGFFYNEYMKLSEVTPYIFETDSGIAFWVRTSQSVDLSISYMDYSSSTDEPGRKQANSVIVTIPVGESLVEIPMSEFNRTNTVFDCKYVYQLQINIRSNKDTALKSGELYFDAFGFYDINPDNDIPKMPEPPVIPDTKATHDIGFTEIELKDKVKGKNGEVDAWVNSKSETSTFKKVEAAKRYHTGKTTVPSNTTAYQIDYSSISPTSSEIRFYYNDSMRISNTAPYIFGEDSVLGFWVYTEQSVDLSIAYMDYSITDGKSIQCKSRTVTLPVGESIVKVPMKELAPDGKEMEYRYAYQLLFSVKANDDTFSKDSTLILDAFGFYNAALVINNEPITAPENVTAWWSFENAKDVESATQSWTTRWAGETGEGIKIALETDPANVYGGSGKSLKVTYNRALGEYTNPCIWHPERFSALGDGISFWIKSEEVTNIRFVALDNNNKTVITEPIAITIGYNIVTVKWSDFKFSSKDEVGAPDMSSVYQLQLRTLGCNMGTYWLDQIGFIDVKDDGSSGYRSIFPPTSYKSFENGAVWTGDDLEGYLASDDYNFCRDWYFERYGWVTLVNENNNKYIKMEYDLTDGQQSELRNCATFTEIDPNGGISFWAKSSEERNYSLVIGLGTQTITVTFKGDTKGRVYNIPFSAFWVGNKKESYEAVSSALTSVSSFRFTSTSAINLPSAQLSDEFTLCVDDISFVDSKAMKRAAEIEHTENGVTLKASLEAFTIGVTPKISLIELSNEQKQKLLANAMGATEILNQYNINVTDSNGVSPIPAVAVELVFDIPEGKSAADIAIYQLFVDGSMTKRKGTLGEDGRLHLTVYRLGDYVMALTESSEKPSGSDNTQTDTPDTDTAKFPWSTVVIIVGAVVILAAAAAATLIIVRKGRGKK